jgi:hypothetical protein
VHCSHQAMVVPPQRPRLQLPFFPQRPFANLLESGSAVAVVMLRTPDNRSHQAPTPGLCLHAQLFEVQVALDAALDVVADLFAISQVDDCVALGLDHRVPNGAVLDQLLLGG